MQARVGKLAEARAHILPALLQPPRQQLGDCRGRVVDDAGVALERVAQLIVAVGQQVTGRVQRSEVLERIVARSRLALSGSTQPQAQLLPVDPGRTAPAAMA